MQVGLKIVVICSLTVAQSTHKIGSIIGDFVIDLNLLASRGIFDSPWSDGPIKNVPERSLLEPVLNSFAALGTAYRSFVRDKIIGLLSDPDSALFTDVEINQHAFIAAAETTMHLPMNTRGFTDFLCSDVHAQNCARLAGASCHPSMYAFPTAYNGRASSLVISGTQIRRPRGMVVDPSSTGTGYAFKNTTRLDFELEMGVFISTPIPYGQSTTTAESAAKDHIFGFVLLNDWSARDVQFAEMIPLGPFNGKASATTISPWVVTPEALAPAACGSSVARARQEAPLLPSPLRHNEADIENATTFNIDLTAVLEEHARDHSGAATAMECAAQTTIICYSNLRNLYWSPAQMVAHHASSGCGLESGDLLGTGTISGADHRSDRPTLGCLFELTEAGKKPFTLPSGRELGWLEDGDRLLLTGWARTAAGHRIGFGDAVGLVVSAA